LIETLRSADTLSVTPSTTSNISSSLISTNHAATNQQQMNKKKKLFGIRPNYSQSKTHTTAGHTGTQNSQALEYPATATNTTTTTPATLQQQQSSIGYTPSLDATYCTDHLTTNTSFSTATVSLMVPPSQQRRHSKWNQQQHQHQHHRKRPPETILSTSQQQYRPPVLPALPTPTPSVPSPIVTLTSTNQHRRMEEEEEEYNISTDEHPFNQYSNYHDVHDEYDIHREGQLQDIALIDNDHRHDNEIDQEHYNRLLSPTNENNIDTHHHHVSNYSKYSDNNDDCMYNDNHDIVVPLAASRNTTAAAALTLQPHNHNHPNTRNQDASTTTVRFHNQTTNKNNNNNNHHHGMVDTKIPYQNISTCYGKFQYYFVRTGLIYALIVMFTALCMLYGLSDQLSYNMNRHRHHKSREMTNIQVAFIGNAYFFVNDIPRLLESISQGYIYQNSCLHAGGSLSDLWVTGNGMYKLWQTEEATIEYAISTNRNNNKNNDDSLADDDNNNNDDVDGSAMEEETSMISTYDYGYCSVLQLLQGYDKYMTYGNTYGKYYSDGLNPCIVDYNYDNFITKQLQDDPISSNNNYWDYIIIVEQTKRMAFAEARNETVNFLKNRYGPLIKASGAIPVLVDTHAFWSSKSNMTGLTDIPTFAALIAQGVTDFSTALASVLPSYQAPLVAPIGLAYLTIWEEDYTFWQKLFLDDGIHSSIYGSYLFACVLFATLFDQLPTHNNIDGGGTSSNSNENSEYNNMASLFMDSRKIVGPASYPTLEEAEYLRNVAGRVTLRGYVPPSLLDALSALQQKDEYTNTYGNR
jgi:hypothetical protein